MLISDDNRIPKLIEEMNNLSKYSLEIGVFGEDDSFMAMLANVHEFGCTINAKGKYLTIPLGKKYKGKSPREFDLFFFIARSGKKFLAKKTGKGQMELAYMLTEQIVIPERSFIRSTFDEKEKGWSEYVVKLLGQIINGDETAEGLFNKLGLKIQKDIQATIRNLSDPPNSSITVANKGSSNPLIDTGRLRQSITYKVVHR